MSGLANARRPKTERELHDAECNVESLKHELARYDGNPAAMALISNWLKQQEQKAAKRRDELAQADAFAGRLRQLREQKGLTQVELARIAGVGQAMVSLLEQGDRKPSWPTVGRLANALGVGVEEFHRS